MRLLLAVGLAAYLVAACSSEPETKGSFDRCAANLYSNYNSKIISQCVDVCIKCARGVTTTCSTSCTLKGAR
jgi:hypothetical protein